MTADNARPETRNLRDNDAGNRIQRDFESAFYALTKSSFPRDQKISLLLRAQASTRPNVQRSDFRDAADVMVQQFKIQDVSRVRAALAPTTAR